MKELALTGFVQTIFFSIIVLLKSKKTVKDFFLVFFFLLVGCELLYRYLLFYPRLQDDTWLAVFDIIYWSLLGPVIYLYTRFVIIKDMKLKPRHLMHTVPLLFGIISIIDFVSCPTSISLLQYVNDSKGFMWFSINIVWEFASAVYLLYTIFTIIQHRKSIKDFYSSRVKKDLSWLLYLTVGFAFYIYISFLSWILIDLGMFQTSFRFIKIIVPVLTAYVFIMGVLGYKQDGVFFYSELQQLKENKNGRITNQKYIRSGLSDKEKKDLKERLTQFMTDEKPYLDCEISLSELADDLNTSTHRLSQVINETYKMNFYDYVNSFRVEEVKTQLVNTENKDFKIISIAYDCGFNSKSAFYSVFKKYTKQTPSEYRKLNCSA